MPLYDYICNDCGHTFEERVPIAQADAVACPTCGSDHPRRRLPQFALHLASANTIPLTAAGHSCGSPSCCGGACATNDA